MQHADDHYRIHAVLLRRLSKPDVRLFCILRDTCAGFVGVAEASFGKRISEIGGFSLPSDGLDSILWNTPQAGSIKAAKSVLA